MPNGLAGRPAAARESLPVAESFPVRGVVPGRGVAAGLIAADALGAPAEQGDRAAGVAAPGVGQPDRDLG